LYLHKKVGLENFKIIGAALKLPDIYNIFEEYNSPNSPNSLSALHDVIALSIKTNPIKNKKNKLTI